MTARRGGRALKRTAKGMLAALCAAAALLFAACGGNGAQGQLRSRSRPIGAGVPGGGRRVHAQRDRALSGFDTDTQLGYGVVVLMKENSAPGALPQAGAASPAWWTSCWTTAAGGFYRSKNIAFVSNDDTASSYKGIARFEFSCPGRGFPETGTSTTRATPPKAGR